jgi:hypothetical protein
MMIHRATTTGRTRRIRHPRPAAPAAESDGEKDAEILALRHQIAVSERELGKTTVPFSATDRRS